MPGNSQRRSRRTTSKKGSPAGSGGKNRQSLAGRGRTLPADERPWHKAYSGDEQLPEKTARKQEKERRAAAAEGRAPKIGVPGSKQTTRVTRAGAGAGRGGGAVRGAAPSRGAVAGRGRGAGTGGGGPRVSPGRKSTPSRDAPELLVGRNPVVEALRAHVPATALYVAQGIDADERVNEAVRTAGNRGMAILEVSRAELDRMTGGVLHQGIGIQVPPFAYESFEDLLAAAMEQPTPLLVALDGVTDPRNLGAVVRSVAAFGGHGLIVPERRSAGMTATAWRTSAGAAARMPIARITNLTRTIKACQERGFVAVGLDADGETPLYGLEAAVGPLVVVVGSEGRGLSRLVAQTCDLLVSIPMSSEVESLNASVAAAVTLAEVARRRAT
ncbi:MAG TPA: 23S rRNA (guanosine(2251)-2'-O)-methyltransferase RlmB [Micromonosporaceae bacterium]|nr:23S rRNA (guanosine(2251)-2'-O)-methyltransferase RlmB [Micromonosporaceae bacterium]